jgi:hypothetical protein
MVKNCCSARHTVEGTVAEFIDPDWGDKVNSLPESTLSPQSGICEFGYWTLTNVLHTCQSNSVIQMGRWNSFQNRFRVSSAFPRSIESGPR